MREYKKYLTETLSNFFEAVEASLMALIGYKDSKYPGKKVIKIESDNFYQGEDLQEFENDPDFFDGYAFVTKTDKSITLIQKLNLTRISKVIKLTLDETKEEIKEFINSALYYFNVRIGGKDFRGYYKLNKITNENIQTKGDVYLVLEVLLDLVESTSSEDTDDARRNIKGLKGLALGKVKKAAGEEPESEEEVGEVEPSEEDIAKAASSIKVD